MFRVHAMDAWQIALLSVVTAAFFLRYGQFDNPIAGLDEQFYLLVGDRMWHGEWPYRDIWDRKPLGLFALFAAIRLLPGNGVLAAQIVATAFAAFTGFLVALLARRTVGWSAATMAAVFYLAGLSELWGDTTQTPVFYNLPVAAAALLSLRAAARPFEPSGLASALAAMLLAGLAIQIKTNAILQGAWFGCWIAGAMLRGGGDPRRIASRIGLMLLAGAAPTLVAIAVYASAGLFPTWWQANVLSIVAKGVTIDPAATKSLWESVILAAPAGLAALLGLWAKTRRFRAWNADTGFLLGWIALAIVDFSAIGGFYPHYALPLLLASCPLVAHAFALRRWGRALFALCLAWPLYHALFVAPAIGRIERGYAAQVVAAIPRDVRSRCLFIYEGPVAYYHLTQACRVSRYAFTAHLSSRRESAALGLDAGVALRAALARQPGTVLTVENSLWLDRNPAMEHVVMTILRRDYRISARLPHRSYAPSERLLIWRLKSLSRPQR